MHCPSTGPERSLLVHLSQSHPSPRIFYQLVAATKTQENKGEKFSQIYYELSKVCKCRKFITLECYLNP